MDIKKLQYDLSLQCAINDLVQISNEEKNRFDFDYRSYLLDRFESHYEFFNQLHPDRWEHIKNLD